MGSSFLKHRIREKVCGREQIRIEISALVPNLKFKIRVINFPKNSIEGNHLFFRIKVYANFNVKILSNFSSLRYIYISYLLLFICMNGIKSKGSIRYAQVERILFIDTGYEKKWFSKIFERWAYKTILILS